MATPTQQSQIDEANLIIGGLNPELEKGGFSQLPTIGGGPTVLSSQNGKDTMDEIEEKVIDPLNEPEPEKTPKTAEENLLQAEVDAGKDDATVRADQRTQEVTDFFDDQLKTLNASRRRQIGNISSQFADFARRTEDSTKRRVRLQETIGSRFGGRFTIEHTADLVKDQVNIGIQALQDLTVRENVAKGKIEAAFDEKSHTLALEEFDNLQGIIKAKEEKFDDIEKMQKDALKLQQEEEAKLANQELIAGKLEEGLTSAVDIFSALGGDVAFDDILSITKELGIEEESDKKFITGTKTQASGIFDPNTGIFTPARKTGNIGIGGGPVGTSGMKFPTDADIKAMTTEARDFVNKVMRQLPTKLKDSEQEKKERQKEALFDFNRGRSIQEVVDEINGFIIQDQADAPLGKVLRRLSVGTGLDLNEISAALNNEDPVKAMTTVENANLEKADGELSDTVSAQSIVKNANRALDLLKEVPGEKLGSFDGRVFGLEKKLPLTSEETVKVQRLETALVNLLNEIRRKSLGTAVTESEVQFLEPLLASILDQPQIIETKLDELKIGTVNNHNRARNVTGLPEVSEGQLLDNDSRLKLYEGLADELSSSEFSGTSNSDLFGDILGNASSTPDISSGDNEDFFNQSFSPN